MNNITTFDVTDLRTTGDIGETARDVQDSLEEIFRLARRWGCVLLLDEADVFLQARDKEDMKRNAIVSGTSDARQHRHTFTNDNSLPADT